MTASSIFLLLPKYTDLSDDVAKRCKDTLCSLRDGAQMVDTSSGVGSVVDKAGIVKKCVHFSFEGDYKN